MHLCTLNLTHGYETFCYLTILTSLLSLIYMLSKVDEVITLTRGLCCLRTDH